MRSIYGNPEHPMIADIRAREEDIAWAEHFNRQEVEGEIWNQRVENLREGMTVEHARDLVARADADDSTDAFFDGADEYVAARRVLNDTTRSDTTMTTPQQRDDAARTPDPRYVAAMAEAARDRAERADLETRAMVENRDEQAAAGNFGAADAYQRLIDGAREAREVPPHERQGRTRGVEHSRVTDRERHERFPFWRDQDRPVVGPGLFTRARGEWARPAREERQR